jgi:hypothetical protein
MPSNTVLHALSDMKKSMLRQLSKRLAPLLFVFVSCGAHAAIAIGAHDSNLLTSGTSSVTTAAVTTQAAGSSFIVFTVNYGDDNVLSVADNKGNPNYTRIGVELDNTGDGFYVGAWVCENCVGGASHQVTLTVDLTTLAAVYFVEITGGVTSGLVDVSNSAVDSATPFTAAVAPTAGNRLLLSFITGNSGSGTVTYNGTSQSFTSVDAETNGNTGLTGQLAQRSVTANGATLYQPNFTASAGNRASVFTIALKEAAGAPSPGVGSTIVFDTRAGGAQSYQADTTHAQMLAEWEGSSFNTDSGTAPTGFFESDVDGAGTNARGIQWQAGGEQEAYVGVETVTNRAPASGWYTQWKMRLGKYSGGTGSCTGTNDEFTLGSGNAHQKIFLWLTSGPRFYLVMRTTDTKISSDELTFSSDLWDENPYDHPGEIQTITVYISPQNGTIRAWRNDTLVADQTGLSTTETGPTTSVLNTFQETRTTRIPPQAQCQYMWDTVIWY